MPSQTLDVGPPELRLGWHQREENAQPVPRAQHEVRGCGEGIHHVSTTAAASHPAPIPIDQIHVGFPDALKLYRLIPSHHAAFACQSLTTHTSCRNLGHLVCT